ncbi:molecular chaperone [Phaffia rhodozyma]|uniref:Molecular chaperone n=1 Tax=Phaffia rhodozyma TaxID=264483 RepID=A0A0F7SUQ7_PHARH|nr:molecular chaperone [Phaffia rhodozyma]
MILGHYYEILGLSSSSVGRVEIKKAYLRKCLEVHPDKNPRDPAGAEKLFKEVKAAYDILSDQLKKQEYDRTINHGGSPFYSFFESNFQSHGPRYHPKPFSSSRYTPYTRPGPRPHPPPPTSSSSSSSTSSSSWTSFSSASDSSPNPASTATAAAADSPVDPTPKSKPGPKVETDPVKTAAFEAFMNQLRQERREEVSKTKREDAQNEGHSRTLQLSGLPVSATEKDVRFAFRSSEDNIEKITVYPGKHLAIVVFLSHLTASDTICSKPEIRIHGRVVTVAWSRDNGTFVRKRTVDGSFVSVNIDGDVGGGTGRADSPDLALEDRTGKNEEVYFWY